MTAQDPYRPQMQPPQPAYGQPQYQPGYQRQPVQIPYPPTGPWPQMAVPAPAMVDGFYLVQPRLKPIPSGQAIGSLVAGIGGILGAFPGLFSAAFNPWSGLTFFMLAVLLGGGAILLARYAKRQIRHAAGGVSGRGLATTGLVLGIIASSLAGLTGLISIIAAS